MHISIDDNVPLPERREKSPLLADDVPSRIRSFANTARLLQAEGIDLTPTRVDESHAAAVATIYAADPESAAKQVTEKKLATLTSASLVQADNILSEFGKQVVHSTTVLRHTITNKLLLETEHPDPRIRLKALELLGKISDVGLFAEKTEITVTHQTSDELRDILRDKLNQLRADTPTTIDAESVTDADFSEVFDDTEYDDD